MRWATQHKDSGLYINQTLILNLRPNPDLAARDLKIKIETNHRKRLVTSFRLPPRRVAELLVLELSTGDI